MSDSDTFRAVTKRLGALPPDPDGINQDRAAWAEGAFKSYRDTTTCDTEDAPGHLLCDLMHWCDRNDVVFLDLLARAIRSYDAETSYHAIP